MFKNKIHIASFSWTNFVQIVVIIILSTLLFNQCNVTAQKEKIIKQNKEAAKDTIEYFQNNQGLWVAEKKAFTTTIKEMDVLIDDYLFENDQLQQTIKSFKKPTSASSTDIKVEVKEVDIKFANPVPFDFDREFKKVTTNYAFSGNVNQFGFTFNFLATTRQTLATGLKSTGLFTTDFTSELTNSNPIFTVTGMTNIDFTEPKKRFGISVFGGYVLTSNLSFSPGVGIGVSYDLIRF